ncbi:MAG: YdcF family protein [Chromatiaceae bacterium]|nr:YdcF family protein [Chromatiaceae bacterium]
MHDHQPINPKNTPGRRRRIGYWLLGLVIAGLAVWRWVLPALGAFLVADNQPRSADAVVVLSTGVDYYPRLIEAAHLVREGYAPLVVVNGNRKTPELRELEAAGFSPAVPWDTDTRRILNLLGVGDDQILSISVEDAYDTISEARGVAPVLKEQGHKQLLIVTSRFHTRRAGYIWRDQFAQDFQTSTVAANKDPFDPDGWWHDGRQIRQLLGEYGGWLFYFLNAEKG